MRVLFVLTFLTALILPSRHAPASPPSDISAEVLHKQAAQGDAWAQHNLGVLYDNGRGVPQDYVKAYMWLDLAAAQLTSNGKKLAVDNRDDAARHMTPARVTEAQRLSQQCQARQFKGC